MGVLDYISCPICFASDGNEVLKLPFLVDDILQIISISRECEVLRRGEACWWLFLGWVYPFNLNLICLFEIKMFEIYSFQTKMTLHNFYIKI